LGHVKRDFQLENINPHGVLGVGGERLRAGEFQPGIGDRLADQREAGAALRPGPEGAENAARRQRPVGFGACQPLGRSEDAGAGQDIAGAENHAREMALGAWMRNGGRLSRSRQWDISAQRPASASMPGGAEGRLPEYVIRRSS